MVYCNCASFVCFGGVFCKGETVLVFYHLLLFSWLYGLQGRIAALLSGSQSWFPLREKPPPVSCDTRAKNWFEGVRGVGGASRQCRPGRREATLFIIPSAPLPGFIPAAGHLHHGCGGRWACYPLALQRVLSEPRTQWWMALCANPTRPGRQIYLIQGKQAPGHTLSGTNEMAGELFHWVFMSFILYWRTLFGIYVHIYLYVYTYFSLYTHFILKNTREESTRY